MVSFLNWTAVLFFVFAAQLVVPQVIMSTLQLGRRFVSVRRELRKIREN